MGSWRKGDSETTGTGKDRTGYRFDRVKGKTVGIIKKVGVKDMPPVLQNFQSGKEERNTKATHKRLRRSPGELVGEKTEDPSWLGEVGLKKEQRYPLGEKRPGSSTKNASMPKSRSWGKT